MALYKNYLLLLLCSQLKCYIRCTPATTVTAATTIPIVTTYKNRFFAMLSVYEKTFTVLLNIKKTKHTTRSKINKYWLEIK